MSRVTRARITESFRISAKDPPSKLHRKLTAKPYIHICIVHSCLYTPLSFAFTASRTTNDKSRGVTPPVPKMLLTWILLGSTLAGKCDVFVAIR